MRRRVGCVLSGTSLFYAIILYPQPFFLLLGAAGPCQPNLLGAASPKRMWLLCHQGIFLLEEEEGGWQEGTVSMAGRGSPPRHFFVCLFIFAFRTEITVLVFNDV